MADDAPLMGDAVVCRFDDWQRGWSLRLHDQVARVTVGRPEDLATGWEAIDAARRAGHWVALLLDYELGEWLEPAVGAVDGATGPRLTALVFARAEVIPGVSYAGAPSADHVRRGCASGAPSSFSGLRRTPAVSRQAHAAAVDTIRAGIARGDYYQVNYTLPLDVDWPVGADPQQAYEQLGRRHPVAHAACVQDGTRWVLSLSPELFVERQGAVLRMRPMKGTAPRHENPARDRAAADALRQSVKNRAENLMIVDLLRNDLGRIAVPGSVRVPALFDLEAYPSVWTLTSTIEARAPDVPLASVLQALFPCGSVTGAPKIAAMRAIRTLEGRPRGIYCGSVGWLAPDGDFSLNVAIRTLELRDGRARFGVGGGIVHDSDAAGEWAECQWKARVLGRQAPPASPGSAGLVDASPEASRSAGASSISHDPRAPGISTARPDRPDLIETMCWHAGVIALWPGHRTRLLASAQALNYPLRAAHLDEWMALQLKALVVDRAGGPAAPESTRPHGARGSTDGKLPDPSDPPANAPRRLRLLLSAAGVLSLEAHPMPATPVPVQIGLAQDWLGEAARLDAREVWLRHKSTHRPWFASATQCLRANPTLFDLIFVNQHGMLCEGSRTNVYVRDDDGTWLTPPASCGLLPGVQRQALLDQGRVREAPLALADLLQAPALRVSNALRGWLDAVLIRPEHS